VQVGEGTVAGFV